MAQEITPEHITELTQTVEMASHGYWLPLAVVCFLFSIIILLLVILWNGYKKRNDERHEESEKQLKIAIESNQKLTIIVERHDVKIENLEKKR